MIVLTFNAIGLEEYKDDTSINKTDAAVLEVTGFELPVMFLVNNINLFETTQEEVVMVSNIENQSLEPTMMSITSSWLSMPVLNFALNGLYAAEQVYQGKSIDFELAEIGSLLRFRSIDNQVEIYSGVNKKTAITDSLELLRAFENFHAQLRDALRNEVPQLLMHPYWASWFKGG